MSRTLFGMRSWPFVVGGAVFIVAVSIGLLVYAISGAGRKQPADAAVAGRSNTSTSSTQVARKLDGVRVAPELAALPVYAVMVENAPDARPLSGPARANVVMEAPVEGGFTRFLLLFDASTTVDLIGPVRSARPYYVEWARSLGALYAHVGGSPEALTNIASMKEFRNLDEMRDGNSFWRSTKRSAPHNVFTRTDLLSTIWNTKKWQAGSFRSWSYVQTTSTVVGDVTEIKIPYGGSFNVRWVYDAMTRRYVRYQAGGVQRDADGTTVAASNVVVLLTSATVLDDIGRLRVRTTGSGKGVLFRDGSRFDITWHRAGADWISFESTDGSDVLFEPGTTWISVLTSPGMMP